VDDFCIFLSQRVELEVLGISQGFEKRLQACDHPGIGTVLIDLEHQVRLRGHEVLEERGDEGIWSAAEIRQVDRV